MSEVNVCAPEDNDELVAVAELASDDMGCDALTAEAEQEDIQSFSQVDASLEQLERSVLGFEAAAAFGLNPAAVALGQASGLMEGTCLETIGCESFEDSAAQEQIGIEALGTMVAEVGNRFGVSIMEKSTAWSGKILHAVEINAARIEGTVPKPSIIDAEFTEVRGGASAAARNFSRRPALNAPEAIVKASRFGGWRTALMIAGAIAAVGGVIAIAVRTMPSSGSTRATMSKWFGKVRDAVGKVKWPFGKLSVKGDDSASTMRNLLGKLHINGKAAKSAEASAAGFTGKAARMTTESFAKVKNATLASVGTVKNAIMSAGKAIGEHASIGGDAFESLIKAPARGLQDMAKSGALKTTGSVIASKAAGILAYGTYVTGIMAVLGLISAVIYFVVIGGMRLIRHTLKEG